MTGGPYKVTPLYGTSQIATVDKRAFRGFGQVDHGAWVRLLAAQDVAPAKACRVLASLTLGGEEVFQAADNARWAENWSIVPRDQFYAGHRAKGWLAPGCVLGVSVLYVESGATTNALEEVGGGGNYAADQVYGGGGAQIFASFNGGASILFKRQLKASEVHATITSDTNGGLRWNIADDAWSQLRLETGTIDPLTGGSLSMQDSLSEWCEYELIIGWTGGARIVDMCIFEVPRIYTQHHEHDEGDRSLHGYISSTGAPTSPMTTRIQERGADDSNGAEPRFGTRKVLGVARRQTRFQGPRILHWGPLSQAAIAAYDDETPTDGLLPWLDTAHVTSNYPATSTLRNVFGTSTVYDPSLTGFFPDGTLALQRDITVNVPGRFAGMGWVRVTVHVFGSVTSGVGVVAVQSGPLDVVHVTMTNSTGWHSAKGWLRVPRSAHVNPAENEDPECLLIRYATDGTATMNIGSVCVDYGWDR